MCAIHMCIMNKIIGVLATFAILDDDNGEMMVRWMRLHCPSDREFVIRALAVCERGRHLSATDAPHNIEYLCVSRKKTFWFFETWMPPQRGSNPWSPTIQAGGFNHCIRDPGFTWAYSIPCKIRYAFFSYFLQKNCTSPHHTPTTKIPSQTDKETIAVLAIISGEIYMYIIWLHPSPSPHPPPPPPHMYYGTGYIFALDKAMGQLESTIIFIFFYSSNHPSTPNIF